KVAGSTYTFDITSIAQSWVDDQNEGVALVNDPDNTSTPFQVVFSGPKTVKAAMAYTPGSAVSTPTVATAGDTSGTVAPGTSSGPSSAGSSSVPPVGNVPAGGAQTSTDAGGAPPQVAPPTTAPQLKQVAKVA